MDFCLRLRSMLRADFVAVPQAHVEHPFWPRPLHQVAGWAAGDVVCLDALPQAVFPAPPTWALLAVASLLLRKWLWALLAVCLEVLFLAATYWGNMPRSLPLPQRPVVLLLAALPAMVQAVVRLRSKLLRLRFGQLMQHFDWTDGMTDHVPATQLTLLLKALTWAAAVAALEVHAMRTAGCTAVALVLGAWAFVQGHTMPPLRAHCRAPLTLPAEITPFVILASQRTGSNMLCGLLHHVLGVVMHNELFNEKAVYTHANNCGESCKDIYVRDAAPAAFLEDAFGVASSGAVGFKAFPEHMRRDPARRALFARVLADPRIKKIILRRNNQVAVAVSRLRAATTGAFVHSNLGDVQVHIAPSEMQAAVDSYEAYYRYLRKATAGQHNCVVAYERLCEEPLQELNRVCQFLGVEAPSELPSNLFQRQTHGKLCDAVANWDELFAAFRYSEDCTDFE